MNGTSLHRTETYLVANASFIGDSFGTAIANRVFSRDGITLRSHSCSGSNVSRIIGNAASASQWNANFFWFWARFNPSVSGRNIVSDFDLGFNFFLMKYSCAGQLVDCEYKNNLDSFDRCAKKMWNSYIEKTPRVWNIIKSDFKFTVRQICHGFDVVLRITLHQNGY